MATTDETDIASPCLCGNGQIIVTQSSPDHPWARASQIHYSATLDCPECSKEYVVVHDHGSQPFLAERTDVQALADAKAISGKADAEFKATPAAQAIIPLIIADIDAQTTMAAKHRTIAKYQLAYESLATYRKRPYDGAEAVKNISGLALARIGAEFGLAGADASVFTAKAKELETLMKASWGSPKAVETGARWMRA